MTVPVQDTAFDVTLWADKAVANGPSAEVRDAVLALFNAHGDGVRRYVRSFRLDEGDAEDVAQEVFLVLCRHLRRGGARTNLPGWIFRVAHNLALKQRAREARWIRFRSLLPRTPADPVTNPEEQYAGDQRQARLIAVVNALPERDQRCLQLRAEGLRYREIAHVVGVSVGTVANTMARAVARIRRADEG